MYGNSGEYSDRSWRIQPLRMPLKVVWFVWKRPVVGPGFFKVGNLKFNILLKLFPPKMFLMEFRNVKNKHVSKLFIMYLKLEYLHTVVSIFIFILWGTFVTIDIHLYRFIRKWGKGLLKWNSERCLQKMLFKVMYWVVFFLLYINTEQSDTPARVVFSGRPGNDLLVVNTRKQRAMWNQTKHWKEFSKERVWWGSNSFWLYLHDMA